MSSPSTAIPKKSKFDTTYLLRGIFTGYTFVPTSHIGEELAKKVLYRIDGEELTAFVALLHATEAELPAALKHFLEVFPSISEEETHNLGILSSSTLKRDRVEEEPIEAPLPRNLR